MNVCLKNALLRHCFESTKGYSLARRRAIEEAHAPLIGLLDDGRETGMTWVSDVLKFAEIFR